MNKLSKDKSAELNCCSKAIFDLVADNTTGMTVLPDHAMNYAGGVASLEIFLRALGTHKEFEMVPNPVFDKANNRWEPIRLHVLAEQHLARLPFYLQKVSELRRVCKLSERAEVFFSFCQENQILIDIKISEYCKDPINTATSYDDFMRMRAVVNQFIKDLRTRLLNTKTIKNIKERKNAADKNYRAASAYVTKLFDIYHTQVMLTIDLGYKMGENVGLEEARKELDRFHKVKHLRQSRRLENMNRSKRVNCCAT